MKLVPFVLIFILLCQVIEVGDSNPVVNFLRFGERSKDMDICPSVSTWQMRSESLCPEKPTTYHCLHTKTGQYRYLEICIEPISIQAVYKCVNACPSGFYRPQGQLNCMENETLTRTFSTTSTMSSTTIEIKEKSIDMNKPGNELSPGESQAKNFALIVISALLLIVIFVSTFFFCREKSVGEHKGEELRKIVPNDMPYEDGHIIYGNKLHLLIGCIEMNKGHSKEYGTAFRVGSRYVMTAYHVVAETLECFWNEVYRNLTPEDKVRLKIDKYDTHPADGEWSLTNVIRDLDLDPERQEELLKAGKEMVTGNCKIKFNYFGNESPIEMKICPDVPFVSCAHDVAILELKDVGAESENCISLQRTKRPSKQLHVIGHPDGRALQHDPGCHIINDEKELAKLKSKGTEFFKKFRFDSDGISDYESCLINREKLLFHCSVATAHGASGSPLIVIPTDKPIVTGMLIHGHPKIFYNFLRNNPKAQQKPEYLIESGISMEKVAELLKECNLTSLSEDIFSA